MLSFVTEDETEAPNAAGAGDDDVTAGDDDVTAGDDDVEESDDDEVEDEEEEEGSDVDRQADHDDEDDDIEKIHGDRGVPSRSVSLDASSESSSDHVEKAEVEEPEVMVKDKLSGATEMDLFEAEMRHVLEKQMQAVTAEGGDSTSYRLKVACRSASESDLPAVEAPPLDDGAVGGAAMAPKGAMDEDADNQAEVERAREVWRELARLNEMEQQRGESTQTFANGANRRAGTSSSQSSVDSSDFDAFYDPQLGEFSLTNFVSLCDSLFLGPDPGSLAQFYALVLPAMTYFGLWMKLSPLKFVLCILIVCAMRHTGTMYKTLSK